MPREHGHPPQKQSAFKRIFASSYYYDSDNVAIWPAQAVNYTNKTQFLFRIEKGALDVNDDRVNNYFPPEEIRIPFRNIIYIGDSATDIPCMKLVNTFGGYSIGVYNPHNNDKTKVYAMMNENRIKYFVPADYSEGYELDRLVKRIIDKTATNEILEKKYYSNKREAEEHKSNQADGLKNNLINGLINSRSFASTHTIISKMNEIDSWNDLQLEQIYFAAASNGQIYSIINDSDIKLFIKTLLLKYKFRNQDTDRITELLD